jgi:hypothetical protein
LGDVMRRHFWIRPTEHRHHLALGAIGIGTTSARALRTPWQLFFGSLTPARTAYFFSPPLLSCSSERRDRAQFCR